jgi:membrane protease YdiL (CAAX protease family)
MLMILPVVSLAAIPALLWARFAGVPWRDLGFVRPRSWPRAIAAGVLFGIAFKLVMKAIVMPLLDAQPINQEYHFLVGNRPALLGMAIVAIAAGFGEEVVFRGLLFERLGKVWGHGAGARTAMVVLGAALFGLAHGADQGLAGAEQAVMTGLAFGGIFAVTGRIWTVMVAHAAFDLTAVALIYWNLESYAAHAIFN